MSKENTTQKRTFTGTVVGTSMDKSIVVRVDKVKWHEKYRKQYKQSKKYIVHDEKEQFKVDDVVNFVECRPISKRKKWRVVYS